jgi:hypothetical protein
MSRTFSKLNTWISAAAVTTTVLSTVAPAYSAAVTGDLNFSGSLIASATAFDFVPNAPTLNGDSTGFIQVNATGNTGTFTQYSNNLGRIKDLNIASQPVNTTLSFANFLSLPFLVRNPNPILTFTLTNLVGGTFGQGECNLAAASGQSCTPFVGSPINFTNTSATSSSASFRVLGFFVDVATGDTTQYEGQFTANFNTQSYQDILAILNGGGTVQTPYTGRFSPVVAAVPEPDMLPSVLGIGMLVAGAVALRRRVVSAD